MKTRRSLRRFRISRKTARINRTESVRLTFLDQLSPVPGKILLDTTFYIDELQDRLPRAVDLLLAKTIVWHSSVTACELSVIAGLLDPKHPNSAAIVEKVIASIEKRSQLRTINPDPDTWIEAGILAGLLARLQQYGKQEQRRVLNDALIFLSAAKAGLTVLTRNAVDYDLLMQLAPQGQAVFYKI